MIEKMYGFAIKVLFTMSPNPDYGAMGLTMSIGQARISQKNCPKPPIRKTFLINFRP
jgi:hypothetical protein